MRTTLQLKNENYTEKNVSYCKQIALQHSCQIFLQIFSFDLVAVYHTIWAYGDAGALPLTI